ncbi:amino acid permease/ SLC12A domain-containing protein [Cadophora sp. MPI-SDFR-AT-0126]|nr:amino acid permease/ SLC12A domain-containing protein [Leotiomycetes sp. MPI-SDFR-AT-0126]
MNGFQLTQVNGQGNNNAPSGGGQHVAAAPAAYPTSSPDVNLRRTLKERHVNMIAFSACVGIGLFLQSGKVIFLAGPGLATIAYLLAGSIMWSTMGSLGEMTALFPIQGSVFVLPARFLDVGVGYAAGWMTWFSWVIIIAAEVLAVAELFDFRFSEDYLKNTAGFSGDHPSLGWQFGQDINPAIWVLIFLLIILLVNCLPVLWYGRLEYIFGCIKMCFIVGLIMFNIILSAKQPVPHESHGWTYDSPYGFKSQNFTTHGDTRHQNVITGETGVFLGMWTAITTVVFSMIGFETIAITAAECRDLENTNAIKMGTRKICLRIILLYALGTLTVSFNVPYTDPNLRNLAIYAITPGQNSVFILSAVRNRVHTWPHIFNAFFIFSATTSGINSLYLSSRVLHALASIQEVWPENQVAMCLKERLERTKFGVPHGAVVASWFFGLLAFLAAGNAPAKQLGRIATNSVVSMLIVYAIICLTYVQFNQCISEAANSTLATSSNINPQAYNRKNKLIYPYKSRGQWLKAVYGFFGCTLLIIFNGWQSFVPPFSPSEFVASYVSIPIFLLISMAYHVRLDNTWDPRRWTRIVNRDTRLTDPRPKSKAQHPAIVNGAGSPVPESSAAWTRTKAIARFIWAWMK